MATIDHDFVEYIVKSLVSEPDKVKIERTIDEKGVLLTLSVADDDLGRVIGKRGATAQSLRTLLRALGTKAEARYNLKIADGGTARPPRPRRDESSDAGDSDSYRDRGHGRDRGRDRDHDRNQDQGQDQNQDQPQEPAPEFSKDLQSDFSSSQPAEAEPTEDDAQADKQDDDSLAQTKKELADLDDLDI